MYYGVVGDGVSVGVCYLYAIVLLVGDGVFLEVVSGGLDQRYAGTTLYYGVVVD